jgi:hypothetical protein
MSGAREDRGEPAPKKELVTLTARRIHSLRQVQDHLSTGGRSTRLEKADVTLRHTARQGQVQLAHAPFGAPSSKQCGKRLFRR